MKVTTQRAEGLAHEYRIVVAAAEVEKQLQKELQSVSRKAKVPGFRPGKIPMHILKQRYGRDVMDSVLWETIQQKTREVISEKNIRPATKPDVKIVEPYNEGEDLVFDVSMETMPEVPALDFAAIAVPDYQVEVPESETQEAMERLTKKYAHLHDEPEGTKAKKGNVVKIDFVGSIDGVEFAGGKGEDVELELGSGQFIPGFEDQLEGAKAGDKKTVKVAFPKDYGAKDLAGKDAEFAVTVKSVHRLHAPELNDDFAKKLNFDTLDAMKDAIRQQIEADYQNMARSKAKKELFDWLDENMKFHVPESMLKIEFDAIWRQLQDAKAKGDPSLNKPEAELRKEYETISERRVRLGIILAELGRKENIQVTRDELTRAVIEQAQQMPGYEQKVFEFYQKNPQHVEELKGPIIEEKVVDFILGKVKRTPKKVSVAELMEEEKSEASAGEKKPATKKKTSKK